MGRPRGVIWQEFAEAENDAETGKERVKCKHCERVVSKRAHRLQQHLVGCKAYARAVELKLTTDEALHSITRSATHHVTMMPTVMTGIPLEPPPGLQIGGGEGSAGRRQLEPTTAGRLLEAQQVYDSVKEYYGNRLQRSSEVMLTGRGVMTSFHPYIAQIVAKIPSDVLNRYYGCGLPVPLGIDGMRVLDLGCGTGRDSFIASALVGARGYVFGVDLTPHQVEIAERNVAEFTIAMGYRQPNMRFVEGQIEFLDKVGIGARSIDLAISNSVLNLSAHKEQAMKEVLRVVRPGGEFQISDIFVSRRLPESVRKHDLLHSECIGGALYVEDFKRICRQIGFGEPREVSRTPVEIKNGAYADMVGLAKFYSITFRCFKVPHMESGDCEEDYGHVATYLGTIPGQPHGYHLDSTHFFESLRPVRVGGNTAAVLKHSWLKKYFNVHGDWNVHFGRFENVTPATSSIPVIPNTNVPVERVTRNGSMAPSDGHSEELNGNSEMF